MSVTNNGGSYAQDRMLGSVPEAQALGRGPAPHGKFSRHDYHHPAAGWGAARSVGRVLEDQGTPVEGVRALFVMNHEDGGFDCPGCAWPDDPSGLHLDICESGVKPCRATSRRGFRCRPVPPRSPEPGPCSAARIARAETVGPEGDTLRLARTVGKGAVGRE